MKYWAIVLNNFEGEDSIIYFENYDVARDSFEMLINKYSSYDEFECEDYDASWFDSTWNEYSTYARLTKVEIVLNNKTVEW